MATSTLDRHRTNRTPPEPVAGATAALFRSLSHLRGKRIFHPHGVGFEATLTPARNEPTGSELFDGPRARTAIVRLSRSVGLPEPVPDALGLAFRVPDAYGAKRHQDFLLVTSGGRPLARHLLLPALGFLGSPYSSLLPYRVGGRLVLVGALPATPHRGSGPGLAHLRSLPSAALRFRLVLATPLGEWTEVATLALGDRLRDDEIEALRLDPSNTGGGIELAGALNDLRRPAYRGSQEGRGARAARNAATAASS